MVARRSRKDAADRANKVIAYSTLAALSGEVQQLHGARRFGLHVSRRRLPGRGMGARGCARPAEVTPPRVFICRKPRCPGCRRHGLKARPFHAGRRYKLVAECGCGGTEEF